jgi:polysaccharide chain length determinant protein (PEP-CTERM system associated)
MHEIADQLIGYAVAIWRRRWVVLVTAWIVSIVGWVIVFNIPDRYQASARVYVDSQSLLKPLLAGLAVQPNINEQVSIMANTLLSRPNLEKVARMSDIDLSAKNHGQMDGVIDQLEKSITLKSAGYGDVYTISYDNKNPALAKKVVQSLLTLFVENGLGNNRKNIASSQKFIEDQVKEYETKLIDAESSLKDFKRQNVGVLPGEMGKDYYAELASTKDKVAAAELAMSEAEFKRDSLQRQLSGEEPSLSAEMVAASSTPEIDGRIKVLRESLDSLRLKYTDKYPDVIATKKLIEELEATRKTEASQHKVTHELAQNPFYQQLSVSLAEATAQASAMRARLAEYRRQYADLRSQVDRIPEVEAQYTQLTRNYEIYKKNYEALLAREESAKMSGDLQSKTDMVDFRVVDPPRVPSNPSFPNRPLMMMAATAAGIAFGIVLAFLLSQVRPTINRVGDLRAFTELPLLGTITLIETPAAVAKKRKDVIVYASAFGSLFFVCGVILLLQHFLTKAS